MIENSVVHIQIHSQMVVDVQKVSFTGKLVYGQTHYAKDELKRNVKKANGYILDMTKLDMIDSTGFGVIINLAKQVREYNAKLVIIVNNAAIKEYFHMAKFHLLFPIVESEGAAFEIMKDNRNFEGLASDY